MTGPEKRPANALPAEPPVTGIIPLDSLDRQDIEPAAPPVTPYEPEPLFNKKLMLAWAIGAACVWFAVKFITPIAIESARTAIVESVKEQNPGTTVTIRKNGRTITITRETPPAPTTVTAPAPPPAPPAPQATTSPRK